MAGDTAQLGWTRRYARPAAVAAAVLWIACLCGLFPARAEHFPARLLGEDDGLENLAVEAVAQDHKGYLWVGTDNGLFKYDGAQFEEFGRKEGLTSPGVHALLVDHQGQVWAASHGGLYRLAGDRFVEVFYQGQSLRIGMNSMLATTSTDELIVESRSDTFSILTSADGQLSVVPYGKRHPGFPGIGDPNGIGVDGEDRLWIGCESEVCVSGKSGMQRLGARDGVPADFYVSFFRSRDGHMWARGRKHILTWDTGSLRPRDLTSALPDGAVTTIYRRFTQDVFGRVLTPTASGFAAWDGSHWTETVNTSRGAIHGATEVFSDREGALWVGTQGSGLLESLGYGHWENYGSAEGLSNPGINALAFDRSGSLWIGNSQMANLLPIQAGVPLPMRAAPLPSTGDAANVVSLAPSPDGGMWAGTELGHIYHVNARGRTDTLVSIDAYISRLRLDANGTLWIASSNGLFTLRCTAGQKCEPRLFSESILGRSSVQDMLLDGQGGAWLVGRGLYRIADLKSAQVATHVSMDGASGQENFSLIAPGADGTLWLAGQMPGLLRVKVKGNSAEVVETHVRPELASDLIDFLETDGKGRLWAGTDHGINVIDSREPGGSSIARVTEEDGLVWNYAGSRAFLADTDGSVWIGTAQGVSHLLAPEAVLARPPFDASINNVTYNDKPLTSDANVRWHGGITLLHFAGLTFRDNRSLLYHYQLDGFDTNAVTTQSHFVRFQKLPPGQYTFRVVAEDPVHGTFSGPAAYSFTLAAPWWRTSWSQAALVVLMMATAVLLWRWRHIALLAQKQKLEELVAERTRELEKMAVCDSLTGLPNRRAILRKLEEALEQARAQKSAICVALIDLDHFKRINDTLGHQAGDEVLRQSAQRLAAAIRSTDAVGRYGGEEFLVIFRNMEQDPSADRCEVVRQSLCEAPIQWETHTLTITCSIGVASSRVDARIPSLVASADHAMYAAKTQGRNRVVRARSSLSA